MPSLILKKLAELEGMGLYMMDGTNNTVPSTSFYIFVPGVA